MDTRKRARDAKDWGTVEDLMQQYSDLLDTLDVVIQKSPIHLELSPAIAWWYDEWSRQGRTNSAAAANLARFVDMLVPMAYGSANAATISTRVADEVAAAPTLVGLMAPDFADHDALETAIAALGSSFTGESNYLGICVYRYATLAALSRSGGGNTAVTGPTVGAGGPVQNHDARERRMRAASRAATSCSRIRPTPSIRPRRSGMRCRGRSRCGWWSAMPRGSASGRW